MRGKSMTRLPDNLAAHPCGATLSAMPGLTRYSTIASIFAGIVSTAVIYDALPPILPALSDSFGGGSYGNLIAQFASTMPIFGMALSGFLSGPMIERCGIKRVLAGSLLIFSLVGSLGSVLAAAMPLLVSRLVTGVAAGTMMACGTSLIAASFDGIQRSRMSGRLYAVGAVCSVTFVFIAGAVADIWWRAPFLLHGMIAVVFFGPVLFMRSDAFAGSSSSKVKTAGGFEKWLRLKPALPAYGLIALLVLFGNLFTIQIAFLMASTGTTSPKVIANVCMCHALGAFMANLCVGKVEATMGMRLSLQLACILIAIGSVASGLTSGPILLAASVFVGGLGIGIGIPSTLNLIMRRVPEVLVPRALGMGVTMMYIGGSVAPLILVPLSAVIGTQAVYYVAGIAIAGGVVLWQGAMRIRGNRAVPAT